LLVNLSMLGVDNDISVLFISSTMNIHNLSSLISKESALVSE
jgi:hypothetical protein